jgi:hypothetical protein
VNGQIGLRRYTANDESETATLWIATWQAVYREIDFAARSRVAPALAR